MCALFHSVITDGSNSNIGTHFIYSKQNSTQTMTHITHTQAQRLKALGFDKPVRDCFIDDRRFFKDIRIIDGVLTNNWNLYPKSISAPTPYEALDWFREVKGIDAWVHLYYDISAGKRYKYTISNSPYSFDKYPTHPEALSALIDKLIEILEEQKA